MVVYAGFPPPPPNPSREGELANHTKQEKLAEHKFTIFPENYLKIIIRVSDGREFVGSVTVYRSNKFGDSRRVKKLSGSNALVIRGLLFLLLS